MSLLLMHPAYGSRQHPRWTPPLSQPNESFFFYLSVLASNPPVSALNQSIMQARLLPFSPCLSPCRENSCTIAKSRSRCVYLSSSLTSCDTQDGRCCPWHFDLATSVKQFFSTSGKVDWSVKSAQNLSPTGKRSPKVAQSKVKHPKVSLAHQSGKVTVWDSDTESMCVENLAR